MPYVSIEMALADSAVIPRPNPSDQLVLAWEYGMASAGVISVAPHRAARCPAPVTSTAFTTTPRQ